MSPISLEKANIYYNIAYCVRFCVVVCVCVCELQLQNVIGTIPLFIHRYILSEQYFPQIYT